MKISNISFNNNIYNNKQSFKGYQNIHSYEEEPSYILDNPDGVKTRDILRKHMYEQIMPYYLDISNPRDISDLYLDNLAPLGNNSYKGSSLNDKTKYLKAIKNSGIAQIIDLAGFENLKQACKKEKIGYYHYNFDFNYWKHPIFSTDKELLARKRDSLLQKSLTKMEYDEEIKNYKKEIQIERKKFIDDFVNLTSIINQGHFYMSCEFGEIRTPNLLGLLTLFNSEWTGKTLLPPNRYHDIEIFNMYNNLSDEDKLRLNFDEKQEQYLLKYLNK